MKQIVYSKIRESVEKLTINASRQEWSSIQKKSTLPIFNYRLNHVEQVVVLVRILSKQSNVNKEILTMAAWLHDIAKPGLDGPKNHGKKSANLARNILEVMSLDHEEIKQISEIIEKHVGLTLDGPLKPLEAQFLWEADKLSKLGATGIIHYIINGIRLKPGKSLGELSKELSDFMRLAERIATSMHTEKAKEIAEERLKTMKSFAESLEKELQNEDY